MSHIIVGIDSGKTSAIACLSLDGRLMYMDHKTFAGIDWIVENIRKIGTPSVIATDKRNPNHVIRKVNAAFNSRLFCPSSDISLEDKRMLARSIGIKDRHERDAYSAAIKAYHIYANKLKQAEHILRERRIDDFDSIKAKIIDRYSMNEAMTGKEANRN